MFVSARIQLLVCKNERITQKMSGVGHFQTKGSATWALRSEFLEARSALDRYFQPRRCSRDLQLNCVRPLCAPSLHLHLCWVA
jgi:hypothetical protein